MIAVRAPDKCDSLQAGQALRRCEATSPAVEFLVLFFTIKGRDTVLLHGFVKKSQQTPDKELDLAMKRKKEYENHG